MQIEILGGAVVPTQTLGRFGIGEAKLGSGVFLGVAPSLRMAGDLHLRIKGAVSLFGVALDVSEFDCAEACLSRSSNGRMLWGAAEVQYKHRLKAVGAIGLTAGYGVVHWAHSGLISGGCGDTDVICQAHMFFLPGWTNGALTAGVSFHRRVSGRTVSFGLKDHVSTFEDRLGSTSTQHDLSIGVGIAFGF